MKKFIKKHACAIFWITIIIHIILPFVIGWTLFKFVLCTYIGLFFGFGFSYVVSKEGSDCGHPLL